MITCLQNAERRQAPVKLTFKTGDSITGVIAWVDYLEVEVGNKTDCFIVPINQIASIQRIRVRDND